MNSLTRKIVLGAFAILIAVPLTAQTATQKRTTPDGRFTIEKEIPRLPTISQDNTGTCWSFATVSFLESEMERIHKKPVNLSEIYPVYQAWVEKIRRYVRLEGKTQLSQGGLSHDVIAMVRMKGIVPQSAFTGLCPGDKRHNHSQLETLLTAMAKKLAESKVYSPKWERAVRGVLDAYLGKIPETFEVDGRTVTAKQYADEILKIPYDDYVEVMSFSYAPFWHEAELFVPDNWMRWDRYLNVPVDAMMEGIDHALENGYTVAVDMDVSERGFQAGRGVAKLPKRLEAKGAITDELRERLFDSKKTTDDHLMHIVGTAHDAGGHRYYIIKNSWGKVGPYAGDIFISRNYVALKTLAFMVHKDGLPDRLRKSVSF